MSNSIQMQLITDVINAFNAVDFPGRKIGDADEVMAFIGKRWQEISVEDINSNHSLFFFSDIGFHYYLPAYLVMILKNPKDIDPSVTHGVIRDLAYYDSTKIQKLKVCKLFSRKQRDVIIKFITNYESLFFQSSVGLSSGRQKFLDRQNSELRAFIQKALEYWSECK